jgi:hypothetical protein
MDEDSNQHLSLLFAYDKGHWLSKEPMFFHRGHECDNTLALGSDMDPGAHYCPDHSILSADGTPTEGQNLASPTQS